MPCSGACLHTEGTGEPASVPGREGHDQVCNLERSQWLPCGELEVLGYMGGEAGTVSPGAGVVARAEGWGAVG